MSLAELLGTGVGPVKARASSTGVTAMFDGYDVACDTDGVTVRLRLDATLLWVGAARAGELQVRLSEHALAQTELLTAQVTVDGTTLTVQRWVEGAGLTPVGLAQAVRSVRRSLAAIEPHLTALGAALVRGRATVSPAAAVVPTPAVVTDAGSFDDRLDTSELLPAADDTGPVEPVAIESSSEPEVAAGGFEVLVGAGAGEGVTHQPTATSAPVFESFRETSEEAPEPAGAGDDQPQVASTDAIPAASNEPVIERAAPEDDVAAAAAEDLFAADAETADAEAAGAEAAGAVVVDVPVDPAVADEPVWGYVQEATEVRGLSDTDTVVGTLVPGRWYELRGSANGWTHVLSVDGAIEGWAAEAVLHQRR